MNATKCLLSLALACAAGGAFALSSSVKVNSVTLAVTDLDPNDGITAAVLENPTFDYFDTNQEFEVTFGLNDAHEFFVGEGNQNLGDIFKRSKTELAGRGDFYTGLEALTTSWTQRLGLTPASKVTISLDVSFNDGLADPLGAATAGLGIFGFLLLGEQAEQVGDTAGRWPQGPYVTDRRRETFEVSMVNTSDRLAPFGYNYVLQVQSQPPIPEPQTYALMALGLATIGWRLRRCRRSGGSAVH